MSWMFYVSVAQANAAVLVWAALAAGLWFLPVWMESSAGAAAVVGAAAFAFAWMMASIFLVAGFYGSRHWNNCYQQMKAEATRYFVCTRFFIFALALGVLADVRAAVWLGWIPYRLFPAAVAAAALPIIACTVSMYIRLPRSVYAPTRKDDIFTKFINQ